MGPDAVLVTMGVLILSVAVPLGAGGEEVVLLRARARMLESAINGRDATIQELRLEIRKLKVGPATKLVGGTYARAQEIASLRQEVERWRELVAEVSKLATEGVGGGKAPSEGGVTRRAKLVAQAQALEARANRPHGVPPDGAQGAGASDTGKEWIDLAERISPVFHRIYGAWRRTKEGLETDGKVGRQHAAIQIPYRPSANYDLRVSFTASTGETVSFALLTSVGQVIFWFNNYCERTGVHNGEEIQFTLPGGKRHLVVLQVRGDALKVTANGWEVYQTKVTKNNVPTGDASRGYRGMGLQTHVAGKVVFHRVEVREVDPLALGPTK